MKGMEPAKKVKRELSSKKGEKGVSLNLFISQSVGGNQEQTATTRSVLC
jgi:hypothetical protein